MRTILLLATEILNDWNLFVNEDKTDFTHVYLASSGEKDEQGNLIAGKELWRKSFTLGSMLCSKEDNTRRISLGYAAFNKYNKAWSNKIPLEKRLLLYFFIENFSNFTEQQCNEQNISSQNASNCKI